MLVRKIEQLQLINGVVERVQVVNLIFEGSEEAWQLSMEEAEEANKLLTELLNPDDTLTYIPGHLAHAHRIDGVLPEVSGEERECPDYIEPPEEDSYDNLIPEPEEPIISKSMGAGLITEKVEKVKSEDRDYSKYIRMLAEGTPTGKIIDKMRDDFGVSRGSAQNYFYRYVKTDGSIKITVIEEKKPAPGKFFTDEDRERIQKELRLK